MKTALITGITGQDGSYLAELLINKGYQVHGIIRRASTFTTGRIAHLYDDPKIHKNGRMTLHYGDVCDSTGLVKVISTVKPDEIYNLAAQSHVTGSFELAEYTSNVNALGTLRLLDAIRTCNMDKKVKFFQASTSEMFGKVQEVPQTESTPFYPRSPYGVSKAYAHWTVVNFRESYGMFACNGIMFNHESPRRGETFVTRKIARSVAKIHLGLMEKFELGIIDSKRDWGHAKDYVEGMWMVLQQEKPEDFVFSTGKVHSVRQFVETAFKEVGREIYWEGSGLDEVAKEKETGIIRLSINPKFYRPSEANNPSRPQPSPQMIGEPPVENTPDDFLQGDSSKALQKLGWKPILTFEDLVRDMVQSDITQLTSKSPVIH